jgi:transcriptional regulator GlxA family with amidase domain
LLTDIVSAIDGGTAFYPQEAAHLGRAALDLCAAVIARHTDAHASLPPETRRTELLARIHAFIEQHLGDPRLTPMVISGAHHISLRCLQRLFQQQGLTVAARIRQQRLERCRRDLADPALAECPIHAIAARWGYPSAAEFSRSLRNIYGTTPGEYRHGAAGAGVRPAPSTGHASLMPFRSTAATLVTGKSQS